MELNRYFILLFNLYFILIFSVASENSIERKKKYRINKCCPDGYFVAIDKYYNKICVHPKDVSDKKLDFSDVLLYNKDKTKTGKNVKTFYTLVSGIMMNSTFNVSSYDYTSVGHNYYLSEKGVLYDEDPNQFRWWTELTTDKFCIDYELDPVTFNVLRPTFWAISISESSENPKNITIIVIGLCISCFFLALVLLVNFLLPGSRVLRELIQMSYVASTFFAFFFLAVIMAVQLSREGCMGISYVTYYFLIASFCWMVVMSYDLWSINSQMNVNIRPSSRRKMRTVFRWYNAFAWGLPAAMTIFLIIMNHANLRHWPWITKPNIPEWACFIAGHEKFLYLYIPMLILILSNWVFFVLTTYNLWKQFKDTSTLDNDRSTLMEHRTLKNRFLMYLKLSIIMGISWVLEVASSFNPNFTLWYLFDAYNVLVGLSVFLIFVCNKKTFKKLKLRLQGSETIKKSSTDTDEAMQRSS